MTLFLNSVSKIPESSKILLIKTGKNFLKEIFISFSFTLLFKSILVSYKSLLFSFSSLKASKISSTSKFKLRIFSWRILLYTTNLSTKMLNCCLEYFFKFLTLISSSSGKFLCASFFFKKFYKLKFIY